MAIVSFDKDTVVDYVPEYNGNRDSDDPCIVRIKFVPYSRVQHYSRIIAAKTKDTRDSVKITERTQAVQKKQFTENVKSVSNYLVGEREVTDPGEFYETADTDLIIEVIQAMESQSKLSEGQAKNSQRASDGTSAAAPSNVLNVPTGTKKSETAGTDYNSTNTSER